MRILLTNNPLFPVIVSNIVLTFRLIEKEYLERKEGTNQYSYVS